MLELRGAVWAAPSPARARAAELQGLPERELVDETSVRARRAPSHVILGACTQQKEPTGREVDPLGLGAARTNQPLTGLPPESCRSGCSPGAPWRGAVLRQKSASSSLVGFRLAQYHQFNVPLPRRETRDKPYPPLRAPALAAGLGAPGSRVVRGSAPCRPGDNPRPSTHAGVLRPLPTALPCHADPPGSPARCWHP